MEQANILDSDGISEDFYNLLWTKDELNFGPTINIPDTVIFNFGQPIAWYFTASNGKIKKKSKQNLVLAKMEQSFLKHVLGYDVVASFTSSPSEPDENGNIIPSTVEYLDQRTFNTFLYDRSKNVNGILQRFIEPKSTRNETVRSVWSPKVCLLERFENIHQLHDQRYGLYERCLTYEGPEYYSVTTPIRGTVLASQLQKICEAVVSHISEVTFGQITISRMILNFKVDSRDKVWLLHTTSIRTTEAHPLSSFNTGSDGTLIEKNFVERTLININSTVCIPSSIELNANPRHDKYGQRESRLLCLSCNNETVESRRQPVTYKSIINHYDHILHIITIKCDNMAISSSASASTANLSVQWPPDPEIIDAAGGVGFGCMTQISDKLTKSEITRDNESNVLRIPPIIRFLHPKLSYMAYRKCRVDPLFLYKNVNVCESCYLVYAEFAIMLLRLGNGGLKKLLTPEPIPIVQSSEQSKSATGTVRPSSADWRAMSAMHRDRSGIASKSQSYLEEANSTRQLPPGLPEPVRRGKDIGSSMKKGLSQGSYSSVSHASSSKFSLYDPDEVRAMVLERETQFFKDIAHNPTLRDHHPLMHLITAQQKLSIADDHSSTKRKPESKEETIFPKTYGSNSKLDTSEKFGAYGQQLPTVILINGQSTTKKKTKKTARTGSIKSAHMDYLRSTMEKLQSEMDPNGIAKIKSSGLADDKVISSITTSPYTDFSPPGTRGRDRTRLGITTPKRVGFPDEIDTNREVSFVDNFGNKDTIRHGSEPDGLDADASVNDL